MGDSDTCKENIKDKIGIEYFDKKDACKIANVSPNTIDNYRKKNIISVKRYGNKNYYSLSDIEILRNNVVLNKKNIRKDPVVDNIETVEPKDIVPSNNKSSKSRRSASEIDKLRRIIDDYAEENGLPGSDYLQPVYRHICDTHAEAVQLLGAVCQWLCRSAPVCGCHAHGTHHPGQRLRPGASAGPGRNMCGPCVLCLRRVSGGTA